MPEEAQQPPPAPQEHDDGDIAPSFHKDMTLREIKASFSSNKGALTRLSNQVRVRPETFVTIKSPGSASQLNESYNKFLTKCNFLHRAAHQLALLDEANADGWIATQNQLQPLQDQIEHIYGDAQVQLEKLIFWSKMPKFGHILQLQQKPPLFPFLSALE